MTSLVEVFVQNRESFQKLFQQYYSPLCNFVYGIVKDYDQAEDVVQGVFIRIWENREKLKLTGSVKSYLFTSARNQSIDYIRAKKRKDAMLEEQEGGSFSMKDFDSESEAMMRKEMLHRAIEQLKPKMRQIFILHKLEGLTYQEISEYLDIPQRTIEYNIYTALQKLKEILQPQVAEV